MPKLSMANLTSLMGLLLSGSAARGPWTDNKPPGYHHPEPSSRPNIVVFMTDDQDLRQNSIGFQPTVQRELIEEGLTLDNHFATVAQCCPSRTSYLRGQAAHNTNLTYVFAPGGAYEKFVASGEDESYLPHWLKTAGYNTAYLGKFMNGYSLSTYDPAPKGWDFTDILPNPYTYDLNTVVISSNGQRPIFYDGYHQNDVMRALTLDRLEHLTSQDAPFYIQIAPTAPHTGPPDGPPVPCNRHADRYTNLTAPRTPNFNPSDEFQAQKPSYLRDAPLLIDTEIAYLDTNFRARLQSLLGVDEMVEDTLSLLRDKGILDNTYVIYTSDNGWHEGQHRRIGGKSLPYIEDTNIPMVIRGPGIPRGVRSKIPSTHIDMAPTFLDIAKLDAEAHPPFLDGRSLLPEWKAGGSLEELARQSDEAGSDAQPRHVAREILNIEYWGPGQEGADSPYVSYGVNNTYKTLRIVGDDATTGSWLFSRWCSSNDTELYNTVDDPYELTNLAIDPSPETSRLLDRLNGLLLVTKSCAGASCRDPWSVLAADPAVRGGDGDGATFRTLGEAMDAAHDEFFASLPEVGFQACLDFQLVANEVPFYPPSAAALGGEYRQPTDNFTMYVPMPAEVVPRSGNGSGGPTGTEAHRGVGLEEMLRTARELTEGEIGLTVECNAPLYCRDTIGLP